MYQHQQHPVVLAAADYQLLRSYIGTPSIADGAMTLSGELGRAIIVSDDALPAHTVRINSKVSVLDLSTDRVLEFTLVLPGDADMRSNRVSVLTPIGAALIGFRKAEEVHWKVPAGLKRFRILDVVNPPSR